MEPQSVGRYARKGLTRRALDDARARIERVDHRAAADVETDVAGPPEDVARAHARGLTAKVRQALLTEGATARSSGELPWRTNFGARLALLRHQRNDAALKELARVYVRDALKRWVPGAQLVSLAVEQDDEALTLRERIRERETTAAVDVSLQR